MKPLTAYGRVVMTDETVAIQSKAPNYSIIYGFIFFGQAEYITVTV